MVDVSERGLAEEKFRLAVEACPNGMLMFDDDGKMVMVNAEVEQQFGYRREELIGRPVDMLVPVRLRGADTSCPSEDVAAGACPQASGMPVVRAPFSHTRR